jgi:hypothetical protein
MNRASRIDPAQQYSPEIHLRRFAREVDTLRGLLLE